jgi:uncharacterized protein
MKTIYTLITLSLILVITSGCGLLPQQSGNMISQVQTPIDAHHTVNVTGSGVVMATPDIGYLNIGVHTEDFDSAAAVDQNNKLTRSVKDALKGYGVEDKDIQTSNFSIYKQAPYSGVSGDPSKIIVDNTVLVTVRNLSDLSKMLGDAIRSGANNVYGMSFDIVDKSAFQEEARGKAMQNAYQQAQQLATLAGGKPGKVISVTVVTNNTNIPYAVSGMGGGGGMVNNSNVPVSSGNISINVDVNVVYELINN